LNLQLCRDHAKQCCWRRFILCENPAWITQVAKLYRKAQSIVVAAMLAYGRQVTNTQNVIPQQILLFIWKGEKRFALRGGQEFAARHTTILIMNSVFENYDRSVFRYSLKSKPNDAAGEKVLGVRKFPFPELTRLLSWLHKRLRHAPYR
jgi:hypothetical protein